MTLRCGITADTGMTHVGTARIIKLALTSGWQMCLSRCQQHLTDVMWMPMSGRRPRLISIHEQTDNRRRQMSGSWRRTRERHRQRERLFAFATI